MDKVITLIPGQPDKTDEFKVVEISKQQTLTLQTTLYDLKEQKKQTEELVKELGEDIGKIENLLTEEKKTP